MLYSNYYDNTKLYDCICPQIVLRYDSRNMGKMSVLFDLELRMVISTQKRYEGTGVCAMRRRIKV